MTPVVFDPDAPHPGVLVVDSFGHPHGFRRPDEHIDVNSRTDEVVPTAADEVLATYHRVVWPSVVVRGTNGSHGVFYRGALLKPWPCNKGTDEITNDCLQRLLAAGAVRRSDQ